jgi:hypothetical protein
MEVERVQEGEVPSAVIASYGFGRTAIDKWLQKVKHGGRGDPLRSSKGTGRPATARTDLLAAGMIGVDGLRVIDLTQRRS